MTPEEETAKARAALYKGRLGSLIFLFVAGCSELQNGGIYLSKFDHPDPSLASPGAVFGYVLVPTVIFACALFFFFFARKLPSWVTAAGLTVLWIGTLVSCATSTGGM